MLAEKGIHNAVPKDKWESSCKFALILDEEEEFLESRQTVASDDVLISYPAPPGGFEEFLTFRFEAWPFGDKMFIGSSDDRGGAAGHCGHMSNNFGV